MRLQVTQLTRHSHHWLLTDEPAALQVTEWVVMARLRRNLRREYMDLLTMAELVEASFAQDVRERVGIAPWRVPNEKRPVSRPVGPKPAMNRCPSNSPHLTHETGWPGAQSIRPYRTGLLRDRSAGKPQKQREDKSLKFCWSQVRIVEEEVWLPPPPLTLCAQKRPTLLFLSAAGGEETSPSETKTETVLELVHSPPIAGHLGAQNNL